MKRFFHKVIDKILEYFGYQSVKLHDVILSPNNFHELVKAYEFLFSRYINQNSLPANANRWKSLSQLSGTSIPEAFFIINSLHETSKIDGDVCEFGVAQGATSALIAQEIISSSRILHLFDSFEGLSEPTKEDILIDDIFQLSTMEAYKGKMACPENLVISKLEHMSFPRDKYSIHKGFIEEVIRNDLSLPKAVSFAYIDFDLYAPILTTLEYLDPKLKPGSMVIVDDYDFFSTGVRTAVNEFLSISNATNKKYEIVISEKVFGSFAIIKKLVM